MKAGLWLIIVLAAAPRCTIAAELAGTWEGEITRGTEKLYAGFDLNVTRDGITGTAFIEGWGYSEVSRGRVDGNRVRFTVDRKFSGTAPITEIEVDGSISGKSMTLAMFDGARYEITLRRTESQVTGPLTTDAPPTTLEGRWKATFVGPIGERPKMIRDIEFDFKVNGNTLAGIAHAGAWPGDCPISEGEVRNGRFSFTASGLIPSSSGIPVMRFEGEIHGDQLKLTMHHQIFGADTGASLPMDAARLP
jgi:hypothetical protein